MEWLKNIALPQSAEHIDLLHYMLVISLFIFTSFCSIILWGTILSIHSKLKSNKNLESKHNKFAKDVIQIVLVNKHIGLMFCILPLITIILIFAQLFQSASIPDLEYLAGSLVLLTISLLFIYSYKNSFHDYTNLSIASGLLGVVFMFFTLWVFNATLTLALFNNTKNVLGLTEVLFSFNVLIRFLLFILISGAITGSIIMLGMFYLSKSKVEDDEEYAKLIKSLSLRITFTATLLIPICLLIYILVLPTESLSASIFVYVVISLILIFLVYHLLYLLYKKFDKTIVAVLVLTVFGFVMTFTIGDQIAISNSTRVQSAVLIAGYDTYLSELKGTENVVELNGENIYKVSCAGCHTFNTKLVGPPHNEVVPKYFGKENQLIAYLRNPVRINPEYPAMPNPGLKPNEAKAVAEYVLAKVKENTGQ